MQLIHQKAVKFVCLKVTAVRMWPLLFGLAAATAVVWLAGCWLLGCSFWSLSGDFFLQCSLHGEPYTMFCTTKKAMLCMKCFRDTSAEARRYCVDLDTAYNQGAKKLDRALTVIFKAFWRLQILLSYSTHCLKITQNVAFEFFNFGIFHQFLSY